MIFARRKRFVHDAKEIFPPNPSEKMRIEYQNQPENAMDVSRLLVFDKTKAALRNYSAVPDLPAFIGIDVGLKNVHSVAVQNNTIIDVRKTTIIGNVPATITALITRYKQLFVKSLFCVDTGWKTTELYAIARQDKAIFACKGLGLDTSRRPINEYRISPSIPYIDNQKYLPIFFSNCGNSPTALFWRGKIY